MITKKGCQKVRFIKTEDDEDPEYIIYRFGYNVCPLACKVCLTDPHQYCSKVISRVMRIKRSDFKNPPTRKRKRKAVESKS